MDPSGLQSLGQYGGFAVLAGCALWALWKSHEISMKYLDSSHARETEALKLALTYISGAHGQLADLSKESTRQLASLCDEIQGLREALDRKGVLGGR